MRLLAWRGVRHNLGRYVATLVAIITGVGFFAATGFVADGVIANLEGDVDERYANVDAAVVPKDGGPTAAPETLELRISGAQFARISRAPGVQGAAGELTGPVALPPRPGRRETETVTGRLWIEDGELNPTELASGRAPRQAGEVAIDQGTAERERVQVGSRIALTTLGGPSQAQVVGITRFGSADAQDSGGTVSLPRSAAFDRLTDGREEYQAVYLRGSGSQRALAAAVEPLVARGFEAQSGEAFLQDQRDAIGSVGRYLKTALQVFALLALFVGGFVIYNTFNVIVAQRMRELAVLAAIGATPKQIKRSLSLEGLFLGLLGSGLGVLTGLALALLLVAGLGAAGVELPGGRILVSPGNVLTGLVLGTLITYASVRIPARRAATIEPIEAIRSATVESTRFSWRRRIVAALLVGLGAAGMVAGSSWAAIGLGALALFVGTVVSGPFIAVAGARLARPLLARAGLEGRLAVDNIARNPQRTATTSNALLIGVFLVTLVTAAGTSMKDFAVDEIKKLDSADYVISSKGGAIDAGLQGRLEAIDDVERVTPFDRAAVTVGDDVTRLSAGDVAAFGQVSDLTLSRGGAADLTDGTIAVPDAEGHPAVGATVTVTSGDRDAVRLEVVALVEPSIDSTQIGALTTPDTFREVVGESVPTVAFVDVAAGARAATEDRIEALADARPDLTVEVGNAIGKVVGTVFDFVINAINGLLGMSVLVALIGIVNTLSLSILERRRELGLLRVIGMLDDRVRRMVRLESLVITGLGTLSGIVVGLFTAWALVGSIDRLADADVAFTFPGGQLLAVVVLSVVLGLLASVLPARRSTRLEVLDAIQAT